MFAVPGAMLGTCHTLNLFFKYTHNPANLIRISRVSSEEAGPRRTGVFKELSVLLHKLPPTQ